MKVIETSDRENLDRVIKNSLHTKSIVFSDKSTSYVNISKYIEAHYSLISSAKERIKMGTYRYQKCKKNTFRYLP